MDVQGFVREHRLVSPETVFMSFFYKIFFFVINKMNDLSSCKSKNLLILNDVVTAMVNISFWVFFQVKKLKTV